MMGFQGTEGNNHYFHVIGAIDFHRTLEHSAMLINCCPLSISSSLSHSLHLFVFQEWGNINTHQCRDSCIIKVLFAWLLQFLLYWRAEYHMTQDTGFSESQKDVSFLHGKHTLGRSLLPKELPLLGFLSKCQEDCCRWKAEEIFKNYFPSHLVSSFFPLPNHRLIPHKPPDSSELMPLTSVFPLQLQRSLRSDP